MSDKERIREVFSHLHASGDTISEVLDMISDENRNRRHMVKRFPAAAVICLILLCAVTVYAATHTEFFHNVFGTGVKGQEEYTITLGGDSEGSVQKTEHYPAIERVDVDEEKAEELTGGYVTAVGQSVTVGDYTFTLEDILMDENNIGAITVHVERPNGLGLTEETANLQTFGFHASTPSVEKYMQMGFRNYLITDSLTETGATYVYYVTPFENLSADEDLIISFQIESGEMTAEDAPWPEGTITVPKLDRLPAKVFSADGLTASVSPIGMRLSYGFDKGLLKSEKIISIQYKDGTEYVVKAENISNISEASYLAEDSDTVSIAFNRLADPENISKIQVTVECLDETETLKHYDLILT